MEDAQKIQCSQTLTQLIEQYNDDPYMTNRIYQYVINQLPTVFGNMKKMNIERNNRHATLTNEQELFINNFMNNNQYFYVPSTEHFFNYDGVNYQLTNQDDILYEVLTGINRGRSLLSWKQKTKISIMRRIKDINLLDTIPESETIQSVIKTLYPFMFSSKKEAKYFLTIIGDNILKKNNNLTYFIDISAKEFIQKFNYISQYLIGAQLSHTFKHKYHDHLYEDCRVLNILDNARDETTWSNILSQNALNIICVACHYSNRYGSADEYLGTCNDKDLVNKAFFIKNIKQDTLVDNFISEYLDIPEDKNIVQQATLELTREQPSPVHVTWKNMMYLWKLYIENLRIPSIIFSQPLKTIMTTRLEKYYVEDTDTFVNICSSHLPSIQQFLNFWKESIYIDENETDFEIEELHILFKKWCEINNEYPSHINDKRIIDLITYYFPIVEIEKNKYLSKIKCHMWDKQADIQNALDELKETVRVNAGAYDENVDQAQLYSNISVYDAYTFYCTYTSGPMANLSHGRTSTSRRVQITSKSYFEKFLFETYGDYIVDSSYISSEWFID